MGGGASAPKMAEEYSQSDCKVWVVDSAKNGCTGMFWRTSPSGSTTSASDWPRNGTEIKGWASRAHPGWLKVDHPNGYWLPMSQYGNPVVHPKA